MLFKRRCKPDWPERLKAWWWPDKGWRRAVTYSWRKVTRLADTPHSIALGCAAGVIASFTPFLGLHFLLAAILALMMGGNLLASTIGTFFGNPLSFPFIWLSTYNLGGLMLGRELKWEINIGLPSDFWVNILVYPGTAFDQFWNIAGPFLVPMFVGAIPLGLLFALISYFPVRAAVENFQQRRSERLFCNSKNTPQDTAT